MNSAISELAAGGFCVGSGAEDIKMSADEEATTGLSFGEGAPAQERQGLAIAAGSQATAVQSFEGMDGMDVAEDKHFDKMKQEDERQLTNMEKFFPELVWRKVLGKLKKKDDIESCSNASPFFGELLEEERARKVVLPKVFGKLAKLWLDENFSQSAERVHGERPADAMTEIWKCRLVCKRFNAGIEQLHRNEDAGHYQMRQDFVGAENYQLGNKWGKETFWDESDVVKFLDHFTATHYDRVVGGEVERKCPFLGRSVLIDYGLDEGRRKNQAYLDRLMEMLGKFGEEVSYFEFVCWGDENLVIDHAGIYRKLKGMVKEMPNLKVLRLYYMYSPLGKEKLQDLEDEVERNPFPQLAKLEMISLFKAAGPLCNHLVNRNRHITRLEANCINFNGKCLVFVEDLPKLTHLCFGMELVESFEAFESCPLKLKLEKLILCFWHSFVPFVPWSRVFRAIQAKCDADSCTDLKLKLPGPQTDADRELVLKESLEWRLSFGKIKRFQMIQYDRYGLDFLLPSKNSLEEITLRCSQDYEDTQHDKLVGEQVIKFLGYEDRMHESNIAKEFPRLKKLQVVGPRFVRYCRYLIEPGGVVKAGE